MTYDFLYLNDPVFLKEFDQNRLKEQYIKINVLDFKENPIEEIQGKAISGNINLDGSSGMRRTANITFLANEYQNDLTNVKHLLSINKKIQLLIGFTNNTNKYDNYPIIWFPQGIYVIISPNISYSSTGLTISLTLHDKMALLNGECGGTLPASVIFNQIQDVDSEGNTTISHPTIYQIIQQLVHHFGGQKLGKIIISDIDNKIKKVMRWMGNSPLYIFQQNTGEYIYTHISTDYNDLINNIDVTKGQILTFEYGEDIGYILDDFIYPTELMGNAGDSVVIILDQIVNLLGNYEYFYDINGNFRFQEIKNYLNTTYSTFLINEIQEQNYMSDYTHGKSIYTFDDANIIQSFSNAPQYQQIKNDFVIWGMKNTGGDNPIPIRYHLAIDKKPQIGNTYEVFFYTDPEDGILKAKAPIKFPRKDPNGFPAKGESGLYYYDSSTKIIYKWNDEIKDYEPTNYELQTIRTEDYRSELYMQGVMSESLALENNYYYTELKTQWNKIYNMQYPPGFKEEMIKNPSNMDFFLDFIDTSSALGQLSVQNIGRRTAIINNEAINCIFEPTHPDLVIIKTGQENTDELTEECKKRHQDFIQVGANIYNMLLTGGVMRSAYEEIKQQLYQYTHYNEQVSLTTLPIYYLEPNTRISIKNKECGIYGDYMINSISLPLDVNGIMSITCTKAVER